MGTGLDIHQAGDLRCQRAHVILCVVDDAITNAMLFVGVEEKLHFQRLHIAADELQHRPAQAWDDGLRVVDVLIERVIGRIEHHRDLLVRDSVSDDGFLGHGQTRPRRSRRAMIL